MGPALKNTFSWSVSRDNVLRECPRKYWFNYYGHWGGWSARGSSEDARDLRPEAAQEPGHMGGTDRPRLHRENASEHLEGGPGSRRRRDTFDNTKRHASGLPALEEQAVLAEPEAATAVSSSTSTMSRCPTNSGETRPRTSTTVSGLSTSPNISEGSARRLRLVSWRSSASRPYTFEGVELRIKLDCATREDGAHRHLGLEDRERRNRTRDFPFKWDATRSTPARPTG